MKNDQHFDVVLYKEKTALFLAFLTLISESFLGPYFFLAPSDGCPQVWGNDVQVLFFPVLTSEAM